MIREALRAFWYPSAPASRLALVRIVVGTYALAYLWPRRAMFDRVARTDAELFAPVGVARVLREPLPPAAFRAATQATLAANVAFVLGWRHRWTGPVYAASLLGVLSYRNSWSMIYHSDNGLVLHVVALALSPAADALSLDARRARRPRALRRRGGPPSGVRYGVPLRQMRTASALAYALAGVAKVKGPLGWGWTRGEALRGQVAVDGLRKELLGSGAARATTALYDQVLLFRLLASGSLVLELVAPLAVLDARVARLWAANMFRMHWGIYAVMKIRFDYQLSGVAFAPFLDLERAAGLLGPRPS